MVSGARTGGITAGRLRALQVRGRARDRSVWRRVSRDGGRCTHRSRTLQRRCMMMRSLVVLLLGAVAKPAVARAQLALDVEPVMGKYSPRGSYDHDANYFRVGTPESPQENAGTAYGVNARLWLTRTFAVQLQGMTSSADHPTVYVPSGGSIATSTRVRALTARAVFRPALPTRAQLW